MAKEGAFSATSHLKLERVKHQPKQIDAEEGKKTMRTLQYQSNEFRRETQVNMGVIYYSNWCVIEFCCQFADCFLMIFHSFRSFTSTA